MLQLGRTQSAHIAAVHNTQYHKQTTTCRRAGADSIVVRFNISFRTEFGQHLRLVGSSDKLGDWDLKRSVPMEWTEGDVWTAELRIPAKTASEVEYKYVVCKHDDLDSAWWKPGGNFVLSVPSSGNGSVKVRDAWDHAFREVQIEVVKDDPKARKRRPSKKSEQADVEAISRAADKSLEQLDAAVNMSMNLLESASDPGCVELLAADRMVAGAAKRATAMANAVDAAKSQTTPTS